MNTPNQPAPSEGKYRFLLLLLLGMSAFFWYNNSLQQQALREAQQRKTLEDIENTKSKRIEESKAEAAKFASDYPD
ncbi:MAG: hypothetical protein ACOVOJ_07830, partial [Pirellula sp.]